MKPGVLIVTIGLFAVGCSPAMRTPKDARHAGVPAPGDHPAPATEPAASALAAFAGRINNEQLAWFVVWYEEEKEPQSLDVNVYADGWVELYYHQIMGAPRRPMLRALFAVMGDPTKVVAAHCAMMMLGERLPEPARRLAGPEEGALIARPPTEPVVANYGGLKVRLTPYRTNPGVYPGGLAQSIDCRADVDPEQFPSLRARWEQHLRGAGIIE